MLSSATLIALLAGSAIASPVSFFKREIAAPVHDVTIHESCNSTERRMLQQALADTYEVATIAKEYTVNNGPADPVFLQYFGNAHDAYVKVLGVWESILTGNKDGVLFRCDNIDGNCANAGWRGHWRGENGTSETVICPLSYTDRKFNPEFCMEGFYLPTGTRAQYWSIDLIHRLLHVPQISGGAVGHFSDDYETALELAHHNSSYAAIDSDALQYFAAHVYGQEVAQGGEACVGPTNPHGTEAQEVSHDAGHGAAAPAASSAAAPAASSAAAPASTAATATSAAAAAPPATTAGSAPKECHTHADGVEHCV